MAPFDKIVWRCGSVRLCQNKMSRRSNVSLMQGSQDRGVNVVGSVFLCSRLAWVLSLESVVAPF